MIISELLVTVPEVRDALLTAADSLLDAARAVVEAADRVLFPTHDEDAADQPASATRWTAGSRGAAPAFGVDLGGTNVRIGVVDADAAVVAQVRGRPPTRSTASSP